MKYIKRIGVTILAFIAANNSSAQTQKDLKLWYEKPAAVWEETLPLGNGRLGMMPDGGVNKENIVLNDITLWSGSEQDANNYEANQYLPEIRKMLSAGKNDDAQDLINKHFICKGPGSGGKQWGCFQVGARPTSAPWWETTATPCGSPRAAGSSRSRWRRWARMRWWWSCRRSGRARGSGVERWE